MSGSIALQGLASIFATLLAAITTVASVGATPGSREFTAARAFDACLPMEDGRVLAAGEGGLYQVDAKGKQLARFGRKDGLLGTRIHAIAPAFAGGVWVGGEGGLVRVRFAGTKATVHERLAAGDVRAVVETLGMLYVATWDQGLMFRNNLGQAGVRLPRPEEVLLAVKNQGKGVALRATGVAVHEGRVFWSTAGAGLWSAELDGTGLRQEPSIANDAIVWSLESDGRELWISSEAGLQRLSGTPTKQASFSVRGSTRLGDERFLASYGGGLIALEESTERPNDSFVRSLHYAHKTSCMGTENALWIRKDKDNKWRQTQLHKAIPAGDIAAFAEGESGTFAGTFEHGVAELRDGSFVPLELGIDPHINALAIDSKDGALWVGTSTTLARYKDGSLTKFTKRDGLPSRHVMSLASLPGGGVLVGTASGAATVVDGSVQPLLGKGRIVTGNVWAVAVSEGTHWLGTTRGLFRVKNGRVKQYRLASGELPEDWVMALAPSDDGIFVGTYKSGVVRLRFDGEEVRSEQLGEGWVNPSGLSWDGKELRAATMYGAFRGDGENAEWNKRSEGPGRDTTAYLPAKDGGEWIVTRRGLAKLAP